MPSSKSDLARAIAVSLCLVLFVFLVGVSRAPVSTALASGISFPAYGTVQNNGVSVTQRPVLNFTNSGCVDNAGTKATDCTFTAGSIGANSIQIGALASLPGSSSTTGNSYFTTDSPYSFVWTGAAWQAFFGARAVTIPVPGDFAWVNQGTATVDSSHGVMTMIAPQAVSNYRMRVATAPGATFSATMLFSPLTLVGNNRSGVCLRESGTSKIVSMAFGGAGANNGGIAVDRWTNSTTFSAQVLNATLTYQSLQSAGIWAKVELDATNIRFYLSTDGYNFTQYYTELKAAFFTTAPDQAGIFIAPESTPDNQVALISFSF